MKKTSAPTENERAVKRMAEYIEREALREAFDNADADIVEEYEGGDCDWGFGRQNILEVINSVPAADVAPVRHGKWIRVGYACGETEWQCSSCKETEWRTSCDRLKYCPFCGAKMDLEVTSDA